MMSQPTTSQARVCTPSGSPGFPHPPPGTPLLREVRQLPHQTPSIWPEPPLHHCPGLASNPVGHCRNRHGQLPGTRASAKIQDTFLNSEHLPRFGTPAGTRSTCQGWGWAPSTGGGGGIGQVETFLRTLGCPPTLLIPTLCSSPPPLLTEAEKQEQEAVMHGSPTGPQGALSTPQGHGLWRTTTRMYLPLPHTHPCPWLAQGFQSPREAPGRTFSPLQQCLCSIQP